MNLPNYFMADLPPEASLNPGIIHEACQTLKRNRELYLAQRTTNSLVQALSRVSKEWLSPESPFRKLALDEGPAATGFSRRTIEMGLQSFFEGITPETLMGLLEQDLGHTERLDQVSASPIEQKLNRASMVFSPELLVHVAAGNIPNPTLMSIVLGLLARSAQFVKCASEGSFIPRLFAHSLYEVEPKLGACLELAAWKGGDSALDQALFEEASCVTATGADETLEKIRGKLPSSTRLIGHGSRLSFAYVSMEVLSGLNTRKILERAGRDIVAWNQLGCLSPHVIYVQAGGAIAPEKFAELLAQHLDECEKNEPRGELPVETAAAIASRRSIYELRAAHSPDTRHWWSKGSTAWTVIYETDPRFQISCLHRFIYVKEVKDLTAALESADAVRGKVSTVGLAVPEHKAQELATQLGRWGAARVCPLGQMQKPPIAWRHDGRPALADLLRWTDWEQ